MTMIDVLEDNRGLGLRRFPLSRDNVQRPTLKLQFLRDDLVIQADFAERHHGIVGADIIGKTIKRIADERLNVEDVRHNFISSMTRKYFYYMLYAVFCLFVFSIFVTMAIILAIDGYYLYVIPSLFAGFISGGVALARIAAYFSMYRKLASLA